jgi:hypothetical protein
MPLLDVTDVLFDPDLADTFTVQRRTNAVDAHGRPNPAVTTFSNTIGVVDSASPNDLERLDDNQRMGRHLMVITAFALRGPSVDSLPDQVVWAGDTYVVKHVDPYTRYGSGFVQAIIGSIDAQDANP